MKKDQNLDMHIKKWMRALDIDSEERPGLAQTISQLCEYFYKLGKSKQVKNEIRSRSQKEP